jgi:hypothetical protein
MGLFRFAPLILLSTATAGGQVPAPRDLGPPLARFPEPTSELGSIRELSDGRVVALDLQDRSIRILDLVSGRALQVGRQGSGPGEYRLPTRLFPLPDDRTAVLDVAGRRLLVIERSGRVTEPLSLPGGVTPLASDTAGRFYTLRRETVRGRESADSVALFRWSSVTAQIEKIGFLASRAAPQPTWTDLGPRPFASWDQWAVSPDGRVAFVSVEPYRVSFINLNGTRTVGPTLRTERVPLSELHRQQWRGEWQRATWAVIFQADGSRQVGRRKMPFREPLEWPRYLPPFLPGALSFDSHGLLWVQRTGDLQYPTTFDVIDKRGEVATRVVLPKRARLLGFGTNSVYLAHADREGFEYLERYRLP